MTKEITHSSSITIGSAFFSGSSITRVSASGTTELLKAVLVCEEPLAGLRSKVLGLISGFGMKGLTCFGFFRGGEGVLIGGVGEGGLVS